MTSPPRTVEIPARPEVGLRAAVRLKLAAACTTFVGPNGTGKGAVLRGVVEALGRAGTVVHARAMDAPADLVAPLADLDPADLDLPGEDGLQALLSAMVLEEARLVLPEVAEVEVDLRVPSAQAKDRFGVPFDGSSGLRACWALGVARALAEVGHEVAGVVLEEPGAFLHPAAQEALRDRLVAVATDLGVPVVLSAESPFVVPRGARDAVVALGRDADGATAVVDRLAGDDPHAGLVGGLFRDPGLGAVLDRAARLVPGTRAVLVFEGGTDEAYLRLAADVLGRSHELEGLAIVPAGGASAAALQAVVLRAETDLPVLVVLDNDEPGRHARDTLANRLGFERRRGVTTYAEVLKGYPIGTEAEDLFDWRFVHRFVEQFGGREGREAITGKYLLQGENWHFDLTSAAKSSFVAWARANADEADVEGWGRLLDVLRERLAPAPVEDSSAD